MKREKDEGGGSFGGLYYTCPRAAFRLFSSPSNEMRKHGVCGGGGKSCCSCCFCLLSFIFFIIISFFSYPSSSFRIRWAGEGGERKREGERVQLLEHFDDTAKGAREREQIVASRRRWEIEGWRRRRSFDPTLTGPFLASFAHNTNRSPGPNNSVQRQESSSHSPVSSLALSCPFRLFISLLYFARCTHSTQCAVLTPFESCFALTLLVGSLRAWKRDTFPALCTCRTSTSSGSIACRTYLSFFAIIVAFSRSYSLSLQLRIVYEIHLDFRARVSTLRNI